MTPGVSQDDSEFLFPFPSYEDWLIRARQELEGVDPIEKLTVLKGDLEILPYYDASKINTANQPRLKPSLNPYNGSRSWINSPKIFVNDEVNANKLALTYLNSGADGILFNCPSTEINPAILLNKISMKDCSVSFLVNHPSQLWLENLIQSAENNFDKTDIKGAIYWRGPIEISNDLICSFSQWPQFSSLGMVVVPSAVASDEIATALHKAVALIDALAKEKIDAHSILNQISFSLTIGNDFFLEIAKLKSLRNLWYQVKGAYLVPATKAIHIHAHSPSWIKDVFQPHGNMIKATTASMAAIAGGCDSLTIEPEDDNHDTMRRIAMNVSSVLREESHFSKVADPTAGSYYLDSLTNQLSEKAWRKFQLLTQG